MIDQNKRDVNDCTLGSLRAALCWRGDAFVERCFAIVVRNRPPTGFQGLVFVQTSGACALRVIWKRSRKELVGRVAEKCRK